MTMPPATMIADNGGPVVAHTPGVHLPGVACPHIPYQGVALHLVGVVLADGAGQGQTVLDDQHLAQKIKRQIKGRPPRAGTEPLPTSAVVENRVLVLNTPCVLSQSETVDIYHRG